MISWLSSSSWPHLYLGASALATMIRIVMMIISSISRLVEKNIHWVKKRCIVSFCSITAITRCELRLAAKLRNQTIIAEVRLAKSRGEKILTLNCMQNIFTDGIIDWWHWLVASYVLCWCYIWFWCWPRRNQGWIGTVKKQAPSENVTAWWQWLNICSANSSMALIENIKR